MIGQEVRDERRFKKKSEVKPEMANDPEALSKSRL